MSRLYSNYPPASKRTSDRPPISNQEYKMLDTIYLGLETASLSENSPIAP